MYRYLKSRPTPRQYPMGKTPGGAPRPATPPTPPPHAYKEHPKAREHLDSRNLYESVPCTQGVPFRGSFHFPPQEIKIYTKCSLYAGVPFWGSFLHCVVPTAMQFPMSPKREHP